MAGRLGRVLVGGTDRGAGFALGPRLVITANHVVRGSGDKPVMYVPTGGQPIGVERVQPDVRRDAAIMWLVSDLGEFLPTSAAVRGVKWRVESPPPGANDPDLHGTVSTTRMTIEKASGQRFEVVQLEVDEHLGDFGGYSGSAVLDSLGRTVVALLVEQKPLRTAVALGERQAASNVLYAIPIGDVTSAFGLSALAARPLRFSVGLLPPGMVTRPGLLDEAVSQVIEAQGGESGAGLVLLRGPGGAGKTVLACQVADDARVWAEFADGVIMLRAGQAATADRVAGQLQESLGYRNRSLADVLAGQRLLLIVDDVWDGELLSTLRANLPGSVMVLATTRGVFVPGAVLVGVGAVGRDEAIQILGRGSYRSVELDHVLDSLAKTLFRWALLLTLAAAEIHRDDELDWGFDENYHSQGQATEPGVVVERAETLRKEFPGDPTILDRLECTPEAAAPRSVDVLVRRSLEWLGSERQARFELLVVYPPGAAVTQPMLEDLWGTSQNVTQKEIKLLVRAGLAQPVRSGRLTIELHDLIIAWLHYACGHPADASHQPVHLRLAGLCFLADGSPGELTRDRAEWLSYHLVAAGAWDRLKALPTLIWRSAFLVATGSDAVFLAGLDRYGHAALAQAPDAVYHAVRTWLFAAHVRALIGQLPIPLLVAMALVGDPVAGIAQACQHPQAGEAVPAVIAAVADRLDVRLLIERAAAVAGTIPDDEERSRALASIAKRLAAADPLDAALIGRALALTGTIPTVIERSWALAGIAEQLAAADPPDPALIDQALALTGTIPEAGPRSRALARIAARLAVIDPTRTAALIDQAVAVTAAIPDAWDRGRTLADIAVIDPARAAALIDQALALTRTIPEGWLRGWALADIAEQLAAADPALIDHAAAVAGTVREGRPRSRALAGMGVRLAIIDPARAAVLIDQALALTAAIPDAWERSWALADIAEQLAAADPPDPALIDQALALTRTIPDDRHRSRALADIAERLAIIDPARAAMLIDQALALTRTIPDDEERSRALAGIAEQLAAADPPDPALIDQALALTRTIPDDRHRSRALAGIAERLAIIDPARAAALIDQALALTRTIPDDWQRGQALAGIAEQLVAANPLDPALIDQALAVARTIPEGWQRGQALAGIAEQLVAAADPLDPALIDQALAVARTIPEGWPRSRALAGIAEQLVAAADPLDPALIDQALAVARTIPEGRPRGRALAGIAQRLAAADPLDPALIGRALALTGTIPTVRERSWALAGIAEQLAATDPPDPVLIDQALALARSISDGWQRSRALAGIAEQLAAADPARTAALIDQALAAARTIPDNGPRSWAVAGIAERLAIIDPARAAVLIDQALALTRTIPDDGERSRALAGIAEQLAAADPLDPTLIGRALALTGTIPEDWERSRALAVIAERLAAADPLDPVLIDQALAVARTIQDGRHRSEALADFAERLAAADPARAAVLIDQALAVARTIQYEGQRSYALVGIAGRLAAADPARAAVLIDQALAVARTIQDGRQRSDALTDFACGLATADPARTAVLIDQALAATGTIQDEEQRSESLAAIAGRLAAADPARTAVLIDQALAVAGTISDDWHRCRALAAIAGQLAAADALDPALIDQTLALTRTFPDRLWRSDASVHIHTLTMNGMLDELSRWRFRSLGSSIYLLTVFLENYHHKAITKSIGLAVLDVAVEFSAEA